MHAPTHTSFHGYGVLSTPCNRIVTSGSRRTRSSWAVGAMVECHMRTQAVNTGEVLRAVCAVVRLDMCVQERVANQLLAVVESNVTDAAAKPALSHGGGRRGNVTSTHATALRQICIVKKSQSKRSMSWIPSNAKLTKKSVSTEAGFIPSPSAGNSKSKNHLMADGLLR
jgi:hypothetical protein